MLGGSRGGEGDASAGSDNIWGGSWGVYLGGIFVGYICGVYLGCIFVGYFLGVERNPLRPAKKGVLAVLPAVGHGRGEEFDVKEVVASQCALHLFHHTSAIFQKGKQGFTNFHH